MPDHPDEPPPATTAVLAAVPEPGSSPPHSRRPRLAVLTVAGLATLVAAGFTLHAELTRPATAAEVAAAGRAEIATRWQRLTAGQVFPASVSYLTPGHRRSAALRVGIAPPASCTAALDPVAAAIFRARGCRTVLRATYSDSSGTMAVTIGVVVMRSTAAAQSAVSDLIIQPGHAGLRAVSFPGTRVAEYGDAQRGWFHVEASTGPYAFFYAAGFADGRAGTGDLTSEPAHLGTAVLSWMIRVLTAGGPPCSRADIRC